MSPRPTVVGVIPARMAATRFPGKPLALILGKPMLWHVWKRCTLSSLDEIVVATCDEEIRRAAEAFGARVVMTSSAHARCNDRVQEAAASLPHELIVNVQGDEPLVAPALIDAVAGALRADPQALCVNPVARLTDPGELASRNTVKVVFDRAGRALYFSRYPIPSDLVVRREAPVYRQVPVMGFRKSFLDRLSSLPEGPLERQESVDLLRALENGLPVRVIETELQTVAVDEPGDVARVEAALRGDPVYEGYR